MKAFDLDSMDLELEKPTQDFLEERLVFGNLCTSIRALSFDEVDNSYLTHLTFEDVDVQNQYEITSTIGYIIRVPLSALCYDKVLNVLSSGDRKMILLSSMEMPSEFNRDYIWHLLWEEYVVDMVVKLNKDAQEIIFSSGGHSFCWNYFKHLDSHDEDMAELS